MFTLTLRTVRARARRLVSSGAAVVLGVAFLVGTLVLGDTLSANFTRLFNDVSSGTDVVVRLGTSVGGPDAPDQDRGLIDASLVEAVRTVDGVAGAEGQIVGYGALLGRDGDPIGGNGPPRQAGSWITDPALNPYRLVAGRPPVGADEIVVNRGAALAGGLALGDTTTLQAPGPVPVRIVGIATFGGADGLGETTWAAFTLEGAQAHVTRQPGKVSTVLVKAGRGLDDRTLRDRIATVLPAGAEAITGRQLAQERIDAISDEFLTRMRTFLVAFAGIALVVATLTISNTFAITLAQRTEELALLRVVGATRRQLRRTVTIEALLLGALASVLGLLAGLGVAGLLKGVFDAFGGALPAGGLAVRPTALAAGLVVGVTATALAAQVPARRAGRIAPVAALAGQATTELRPVRRPVVLGAALLAGGGAMAVAGALSPSLAILGIGALLLLAGTVAASPAAVAPVAALAGGGRGAGSTRRLAAANARRHPRRTSATATALVLGVAVVSLITVFATSFATSLERQVDEGFAADLSVNTAAFGGERLSPAVTEELRRVPEVEDAVALGGGPALVDGRRAEVTATDLDLLDRAVRLTILEGSLAGGGRDGIAVDAATTGSRGWMVGSTVPLGFADGTTATTRIVAVYETNRMLGPVLVPTDLWRAHAAQPSVRTAFVNGRPGVSASDLRRAVTPVVTRLGGDVQDRAEYAAATTAGLDMLLGVVYALLALAVLIALLGIATTLSLAVHERRREIGLLRAVGQTRRQVRAVLRVESVIVSLLGTGIGMSLGVVLGWALFTAVAEAPGFTLPVGRLGVIALLGGLAGGLAARRPARRAARTPILDAIGSL